MYQVNFSDQCIGELNKLDKLFVLEVIDELSSIDPEQVGKKKSFGKFYRDGKTLYRLRVGDYRLYFEIRDDIIFVNYILQHHTLADFVFRFKLPYKEETMIEQEDKFWKYIESLKK